MHKVPISCLATLIVSPFPTEIYSMFKTSKAGLVSSHAVPGKILQATAPDGRRPTNEPLLPHFLGALVNDYVVQGVNSS